MMLSILKRYANRKLQRENQKLTADLEAERRRLAVVEAERDTLALVLARDRSRIEAEIASYQRRKAEQEGAPNERTGESVFDG